MPKQGYVYIMASDRNGTLYTGVTSNINARAHKHKQNEGSIFTAKYGVNKLVYCEVHDNIEDAIAREKAIKKWNRAWKLEAIEKLNPDWLDLSETLL